MAAFQSSSSKGCLEVEAFQNSSAKDPQSELRQPSPLEVGEMNHFSVELIWEDALKEANMAGKGKGAVKVVLQRKDDNVGRRGEWINCYKGMAKKTKVSDLSPHSRYLFRYHFEQKDAVSDWSSITTVSTTKEPLYAEDLHMAIKKQNLDDLESVLKSGDVSPDVQNEDGFTALMAAAKKPFIEGIEMLIEYGADVNFKNKAGKTALMVACTASILDSVKMLRKHGADYTIADNGGCTAIHWAVDSRSVKLLDWMALDHADLNIKDSGSGGWTPLIRCANMHGDREVGLSLMMNGADIHGTDHNGSTALHHAVNRKHFDLTQVLLQRKADPNCCNKERTTPWSIACSTDDRKRFALLMEPYVEAIKRENKQKAIKQAQQNTSQNALKASVPQKFIYPVQ